MIDELVDFPAEDFLCKAVDIWKNQWFLLASGDYAEGDFNCMTVAWGSFGYMWNMPFVQVVVRPTRYTFAFSEKYPSFSLCAFDKKYKDALNYLGSVSGRDEDKISKSGLTPVAAKNIQAPVFKEAELILECNRVYWDDFKPANFIKGDIHNHYPKKDYHRIYFGEIIRVYGAKRYLAEEI